MCGCLPIRTGGIAYVMQVRTSRFTLLIHPTLGRKITAGRQGFKIEVQMRVGSVI